MEREHHWGTYLVIFYMALTGALLLYVKIDYWSFVDWFINPVSPYDLFSDEQSTGFFGFYLLLLKYTFLNIIESIKEEYLVFNIDIFGYDLLYPVIVIYLITISIAVIYFSLSKNRNVSHLPVILAVATIFLYFLTPVPVMKSDVDQAFTDFNYSKVNDIDYIGLLRQKKFTELDQSIGNVEELFRNKSITEQQYQFEFNKFDNGKLEDKKFFDKWVEVTTIPETAYMVRGFMAENWGWEARGSAWIKDTSDEQIKNMKKFFELATSDHNTALNIDNNRLFSYVSLFHISKSKKNDDSGDIIYQRAIKNIPNSYVMHYKYINSIVPKWGGSYEKMLEASVAARENADHEPKLIALNGQLLKIQGISYKKNENYQDALANFNKALFYGARGSVFEEIAYTYEKMKDHEGVIKNSKEALKYHADTAFFWIYSASSYLQLKNTTKAKEYANKAALLYIDRSWLNSRLAWVYEALEMHPEAVKFYRQAVDENKFDEYSIKRLASLYYYKHISDKEVLPYMKRWTELSPDSTRAWGYYGEALKEIDVPNAVIALNKYRQLIDKDDPKMQGEIEEIDEYLENAAIKKDVIRRK